jgi:hypothetical protein
MTKQEEELGKLQLWIREILTPQLHATIIERDRYKEALERILTDNGIYCHEGCWHIAKEVLRQQ